MKICSTYLYVHHTLITWQTRVRGEAGLDGAHNWRGVNIRKSEQCATDVQGNGIIARGDYFCQYRGACQVQIGNGGVPRGARCGGLAMVNCLRGGSWRHLIRIVRLKGQAGRNGCSSQEERWWSASTQKCFKNRSQETSCSCYGSKRRAPCLPPR